jgi:hypothetical protein
MFTANAVMISTKGTLTHTSRRNYGALWQTEVTFKLFSQTRLVVPAPAHRLPQPSTAVRIVLYNLFNYQRSALKDGCVRRDV